MPELNLASSKKYIYIFLAVTTLIVTVLAILVITSRKPAQIQKTTITKEDFIQKALPYTSEQFGIIYNSKKQTLYVNVFKPPYEENRQKALEWVKNRGIDPAEFKIFYSPTSQFKSINPK